MIGSFLICVNLFVEPINMYSVFVSFSGDLFASNQVLTFLISIPDIYSISSENSPLGVKLVSRLTEVCRL